VSGEYRFRSLSAPNRNRTVDIGLTAGTNYVVQRHPNYGFACEDPPIRGNIVVMPRSTSRVQTDEVSRAIIEQLQSDGRRSYASIGAAVGLSEAAVRQRVQKLIDSGVMQIVAVTDPMQIGFARQAMVGIAVSGDVEAVAAKLADIAEVDYLVVTAGSWDILAEVVVEDDEHLLQVVNRRIRSIDGIERTESWLYLKLTKQTYNWGAK
jgi:Lrp/AsnC family transcriptional regulator for asnA, asnC and gidA